jgi:hypothetical protein
MTIRSKRRDEMLKIMTPQSEKIESTVRRRKITTMDEYHARNEKDSQSRRDRFSNFLVRMPESARKHDI